MQLINENDVIVIFGGRGFVGRYLVRALAASGARIKVVSKSVYLHDELSMCGAVGQIVTLRLNGDKKEDIIRLIEGSTHVVNLLGILYEKGKQTFDYVHVNLATKIAAAARACNIQRLVHMSALGVDYALNSKYAGSKLLGEMAVMQEFPDATILRPSVIFGPEDNFINKIANLIKFLPFFPLIAGGTTKFQPIYVNDVAKIICMCLQGEELEVCGKIFELGGEDQYSFKQIVEMILKIKHSSRLVINIPFFIAIIQGFFLGLLPNPLLTVDQVRLLETDNIVRGQNGLKIFDINPTPIKPVIEKYL